MSETATVLAAEADYEDGVRCVVMPCCGFTFDARHFDTCEDDTTLTITAQYTCPCCAPISEGGSDA